MTETILLDCDDVLLDWIGGFREYATTRLQRPVTGEPKSWDMGEWLGTSNAVAMELVEEFNASSHFGELEAVKGAEEIIENMRDDKDVRLHVITSCSSDVATVALRRKNLEHCFGEGTFDSIHCLDLGQSKLKILQAWSPGALWIEDNYKNAMLGIEAGHHVLIRERPHNAEYRELHENKLNRFTDWAELGVVRMKYRSTKTYQDIGPVAYRQHLAESHCNLIHGYSLSFKFTFEADELDARNWVVDFGSLRPLKQILEDSFDHTLLVAEDDPHLDWYQEAQRRGIARVVEMPALGCEAIADMVMQVTEQWLKDAGYGDRVRVVEVEVFEHGANSAMRTA